MFDTTETKPTEIPIARKPIRKSRRIVKRLVIWIIVLAILGAAGYIVFRMLMGPSDGVIVNNTPSAAAQVPAPELEQFEGKYMTFAVPNSYVVQPADKDNISSLETHTFIASGMMNKILTTIVTALPSGKLADDSAYYMRSLHPEIYKMSTQTLQGEKVVVALNSTDAQQSAFWLHGGKLLTLTVSSVSINSRATAQEYQNMLESVRWR